MSNNHKYGWVPQTPDHRDLSYTSERPTAIMPTHIDLGPICTHVEDQGQLGSCTAHATTSAMEFLYRRFGKKVVPDFSRLYCYYASRVWVEGTSPKDDSGSVIRNVMKAVAKYGLPLEATWPYVIGKFSTKPSAKAQKEALNHQVSKYLSVKGLSGLRTCLADGYPVVIGFSVPENMETAECAQTGVIKFPAKNEKILGGHAVLVVGYDDATRRLKFLNSWGADWGDKGFGYLPYEFVEQNLADDFWTIRLEEW